MKNLLLLSAMLLCAVSATAQLYVTPNGSTDSYVYVNDQILYVEDDVQLVANNAGTTEASIYLREQAQLIQGSGTTPNSGTGFISVFQDSNADSYDYNFWGSPVGDQTLGGSGNQNFGILRVHDSLTRTNSVVTNTTASHNGSSSPLTISRRWLYINTPSTAWQQMQTNTIVQPGYGFTMKGTDVTVHGDPLTDPQNQLYDFRGRANNGDISIPVSNGMATIAGNPYPSALDLNRVVYDSDNSEMGGQVYYWDEDRSINSHFFLDNKGGYGTWVPLASDPNGTSAGAYTAPMFLNYDNGGNPSGGNTGTGASFQRRFAPIGQGFRIVGVSTGTVIFKNSHRRYIVEGAANNSQFRNADTGNPDSLSDSVDANGNNSNGGGNTTNTETIPQMRLHVFFGESHYRDLLLVFSDETTDGYDMGWDGRHPMDGATAEAYFPITDDEGITEPYVIQSLPFAVEKMIPINFNITEETKMVLQAVEEINLPFDHAYLFDSERNAYKKITDGDDVAGIVPPGQYEGRFFIVFRAQRAVEENSPATTRTEEVAANVTFFQNNPAAQLEVSNPEGYDIKQAHIFDMSGKLVYSGQNLGNSTRLTFPTATFSDGVYLVRLTTSDNVSLDYKISVFNK